MTSTDILKMKVDITSVHNSVNKIEQLISKQSGGYVCVANVHMCMEVFDNDTFKDVVNSADLVVPDGRPLFWAQKLLGYNSAKQVRGQNIMNALCERSVHNKLNIGLYGGSDQAVLDAVKHNLEIEFPGINISYSYSPPFRPLNTAEVHEFYNSLREKSVDVLFVGIGCPKQENFMAVHKEHFNGVMLGVGAAFDFIAGSKKHAPKILQQLGLEWFFRLCTEKPFQA